MKLKTLLTESIYFDWNFIETIAQWMNYGLGEGDSLKKVKQLKIDNRYKQCRDPLYRLILLKDKKYREEYGSWTTDRSFIHDHYMSPWYNNQNDNDDYVMIVERPVQSNILLNINSLFSDPRFKKSIDYFEDEGKFFNEGLDLGDSQSEVIYKASYSEIKFVNYKDFT